MNRDETVLPRELDARLTGGPILPSSRARTLERIRDSIRHGGQPRRPRVRPSVLFACGALAAVLVVSILGRFADRSGAPPTVDEVVAPQAALAVAPERAQPPCASQGPSGRLDLVGSCSIRLDDPSLTIASAGSSSLRVEARTITLERGWVVFDVDAVTSGPPVRVRVAAGVVEVVGTRFSVFQDETRGHIELVEGTIWFEDLHGTRTLLEAGGRYAWEHGEARHTPGIDPASAPPPDVRASAPSRRTSGNATAGRPSLDTIARLRAKGRYAEALALIEGLSAGTQERRMLEVLHYEAGTILDDGLEDRQAACRHWAEHRRRFGLGRYRQDVEDRLVACAP